MSNYFINSLFSTSFDWRSASFVLRASANSLYKDLIFCYIDRSVLHFLFGMYVPIQRSLSLVLSLIYPQAFELLKNGAVSNLPQFLPLL